MNEAPQGVRAESQSVNFTEKNLRNFWRKVNKEGSLPDQENPHYKGLDRCWEWTGAIGGRLYKSGRGYGQVKLKDKLHASHRISWMIEHGYIPEGKCVLHRCDNSKCCNPSHLFLGSLAENNRDREQKGRGEQPSGDANGNRMHPEKTARGERQGSAKLTAEKVRAIRVRKDSSPITYVALAREYGVDPTLIRKICLRRLWKHVT